MQWNDLVGELSALLAQIRDPGARTGVCSVTRIYADGQLIEVTVSVGYQTYEPAPRIAGGT